MFVLLVEFNGKTFVADLYILNLCNNVIKYLLYDII